MATIQRTALAGMALSLALACSDEPFGPVLSERWGGTGAELDARPSPPTLQLQCGVVVRFQDGIPLDQAGRFTVDALLISPPSVICAY